MPKNFNEKQISNYVFERYKINLEYNFIDINKLSRQVLLEKESMFGYIMFIEKAENIEELIENLEIIIKATEDENKLEELANIISYLLSDILEVKIQQELIEKIERKVGEKNMSDLRSIIDRLATQSVRDIQRGRKDNQQKVIKNMLNKKLDEQLILEITEIEKEELEEIKSELAIQG